MFSLKFVIKPHPSNVLMRACNRNKWLILIHRKLALELYQMYTTKTCTDTGEGERTVEVFSVPYQLQI